MPASAPSDEELIVRYARGDVAAFEALYQRHESAVWRFLLRRCGQRAVAEELMQELWFAVAREAPRFRAGARFTAWLFTMARNRAIDHLRSRKPVLSLDAAAGEEAAPLIEQLEDPRAPAPAAEAERAELGAGLVQAVQQLPEEQREAFLLQAEGGLSLEEISSIMGVGFETTKSRLRYARTRLQGLLAEFA